LHRTTARQQSRLLCLKECDAPTNFFHCHANARHHQKHIHSLVQDGQLLVAEESKAAAAFAFFDDILGTPPSRSNGINLHNLDLSRLDLASMCERFTDEEQTRLALNSFPCQQSDFLLKYLGIPLSVTNLPKSALQLLADKVADRLPVWKGNRCGRLALIKSILSAIPVHTSIVMRLPPWLLRAWKKL
jgi:hypothetical protein